MIACINNISIICIMKMAHDDDFDLNLLMVLDALLREQHLTRAASELGLSQSGMSHALARLREFYDDPLFIRSANGMQPTARALELAAPVASALGTIRHQVLSRAHFDPKTANRTFTLCLTDLGEIAFLPELMSHFQREAPNCTLRSIHVPSAELAQTLESGAADLAIGARSNVSDQLYQQLLFTQPFVTLASTRNTRVSGDTLTLDLFTHSQHIAVDLGDPLHEAFDQVIEAAGIERRIFLRTPHFLSVPLLLERNPCMLATVPRALGVLFSRYGNVKVFAPPVTLPEMALRQYWHIRYHRDAANLWLRGTIKELYGGNGQYVGELAG
ncbi:LysR family transcriptional regulator [Burkholderia stabilis]|uniref:LysR family transcriptional regulator n=1 Tax=Burkholderia stabilis TaxID=95485 RepID=UPI00158BEBD4|nr:LysR family transcriptional regulator [Burkholderia stabilis]